jgi:hypothetical protein
MRAADGGSPRNTPPPEVPPTGAVTTDGTGPPIEAPGSASSSELHLQACDSQSTRSGTASPPDLNAAFGQAEPRLDDGITALCVGRRIFGMQSRLAAEHHSPVDTFRATSRTGKTLGAGSVNAVECICSPCCLPDILSFLRCNPAVVLDMVTAGTDLAAPPPQPIIQSLNLLVVRRGGLALTDVQWVLPGCARPCMP